MSGASSCALAIALGLMGAAPALAQETEVDAGTELPEIVVTARRVEESLQDVPLSITAMNSEMLADAQISQVQDLGAAVPNVNTGKTSVPGAGGISIRGVSGQSLPRIGLDNRVGVYLDGVYLARAQGQSFALADIERIEVLRGPQGTLFGRNVTAGSINIVTGSPTGEFEGVLEAGFGSRNRQRYRATVNTPEFAGFSARVTYTHDEQDGDIKNRAAGFRPGPIVVNVPAQPAVGTTPASEAFNFNYTPKAAAKNFGDQNNDSLLIAVRYEGIENLTVDYKFDWNDQYDVYMSGMNVGYVGSVGNGCTSAAIALGASTNACGGTVGVVSTPGAITGNADLFTSTGAQNFSLGTKRPEEAWGEFTWGSTTKSIGHNLTINYELTDDVTLRSITAYRHLETEGQSDQDGGAFTVNNSFLTATNPALYPASQFPAGGVTPMPLALAFVGQDQKQISQEFQVIGTATPWLDYLVGMYYFREHGRSYQFTVNSNVGSPAGLVAAVNGLAGIPPYAPNGGVNNWGIGAISAGDYAKVTSSSHAIFGRLTFRPTDQLDIVVGGRYTRDRKSQNIPQFMANFLDFDAVAPGRQQVPTTLIQDFDKFTWDATATYNVTDSFNVYARYATAYLAGGAIRNTPFEPETTKAAEVGFKSESFDRRLRLNAAAFWQESKNSQFTSIVTGLPAPINVATIVRNLGSVEVKGFEVEAVAAPIDGLTLSGSIGYTDPDYVTLPPVTPIIRTQVPKLTAQFAVQYDTQPIWNDAFLTFRLDGNYRSRFTTQTPTIPMVVGETGGTLPAELLALYGLPNTPEGRIRYARLVDDSLMAGGYWLLNGRVSLSDIDVAGRRARISAFVTNLLDEDEGKVFTTNFGISAQALFVTERSFGIDLSLEF